jgi:hypothetical protein
MKTHNFSSRYLVGYYVTRQPDGVQLSTHYTDGEKLEEQKLLLPLPHHHPRPVLQRLRQMRRLAALTPRQIGNRARQLEDAVIRPRR